MLFSHSLNYLNIEAIKFTLYIYIVRERKRKQKCWWDRLESINNYSKVCVWAFIYQKSKLRLFLPAFWEKYTCRMLLPCQTIEQSLIDCPLSLHKPHQVDFESARFSIVIVPTAVYNAARNHENVSFPLEWLSKRSQTHWWSMKKWYLSDYWIPMITHPFLVFKKTHMAFSI